MVDWKVLKTEVAGSRLMRMKLRRPSRAAHCEFEDKLFRRTPSCSIDPRYPLSLLHKRGALGDPEWWKEEGDCHFW